MAVGNISFFLIFALIKVVVSSKKISLGNFTYERPYESPKNESLYIEFSVAKVKHDDYASIRYPPDVNAIIVRWKPNNCSPHIFCGRLHIGIYEGLVRGELSLVADKILPIQHEVMPMIIKRADTSQPLIIRFLNIDGDTLAADSTIRFDILPAFESPPPKHYMIVSYENQEVYTYCLFNNTDLKPFETDMKNCPVPSTSGPYRAGADTMLIILGACIGVGFLVAIIGVVILLVKRRSKNIEASNYKAEQNALIKKSDKVKEDEDKAKKDKNPSDIEAQKCKYNNSKLRNPDSRESAQDTEAKDTTIPDATKQNSDKVKEDEDKAKKDKNPNDVEAQNKAKEDEDKAKKDKNPSFGMTSSELSNSSAVNGPPK